MEHRILPEYSRYRIYENGEVHGCHGLMSGNDNFGYLRVKMIRDDGKTFWMSPHRLVAALYHGMDIDDMTLEPDHKDRNKHNNHKDNIEVVTKRENSRRRSGWAPNSCIDTDTDKQCSKCKGLKPRTEFAVSKGNADGLGSWCGACTRDYNRAFRAKRKLIASAQNQPDDAEK